MPAEIIRSWLCLNSRCGQQFTSWEPNPSCSSCGCVRVQWVPGGGHIGGTAKGADKELRALADMFAMPDMNSAQRDRGAKKVAPQPVADHSGPMMQFGPGFAAPIPRGASAMCVPSSQHVDFKVKASAGVALGAGKLGLPSVQSGTAIEATHRPRNP